MDEKRLGDRPPPSAPRDRLDVKAVLGRFQGWPCPDREQVAVVVRYRAHWRASGVDVEAHESALWTVHDGKVVRYEWFHGPTDALEAAGLGD